MASAVLATACGSSTTPSDGSGDSGPVEAGNDAAATTEAGRDAVVDVVDATAMDVRDAGSSDAGSSDAGSSDAGASDAGSSDAGASDATDVAVDAPDDVGTDDAQVATDSGECTATLCNDLCVDLDTDPRHCGDCAIDCTSLTGVDPNTVSCQAGACVVAGACASGFDDCNQDPSDGCETSLTTTNDCGACGNACTAPANATATCSGSCSFVCNPHSTLVAGACVCDVDYTQVGNTCVVVRRQIAPLSTARVTSRRPTLTWFGGGASAMTHVELCTDRACNTHLVNVDTTGTSFTPSTDLPHGMVYWRLTPIVGGVLQTSLASRVWEFKVGARTAPISTSWGTTLDLNGDGYADMAASAVNALNYAGLVMVFSGGAFGAGTLSAEIDGIDGTNTAFGYQMINAGDVNGDGFGDLAAAPITNPGKVYLFFGSASGIASTPSQTIVPAPMQHDLGTAPLGAIGDVNHDGYADVAMTTINENTSLYDVQIYLGSATGLGALPAQTLPCPTVALGDFFGSSLASAGDLNGDGYGDVAVGSFGVASGAGVVYVYLGGPSMLPSSPSVTINAPGTGLQYFGTLAAPADFNGDGYADLLVDAPLAATNQGRAYVFLGHSSGVSTTPDVTLSSPSTGQGSFGVVLTVGDINADGYDDAVVPSGSPEAVYFYPGGSAGIPTTPSQTLSDPSGSGTDFGRYLDSPGDTNGDGYDDLVVGADVANSNDGMVYIFAGGQTGFSTTVLNRIQPASGSRGRLGGPVAWSTPRGGRPRAVRRLHT